MITGDQFVELLCRVGVTDVVWIPDSQTGTWDAALSAAGTPRLIRATREGEAIAIAAGLQLGGRRPLIVIQCTGLFEAGDSLRNFVHDLQLPLILLVGLRSYHAHREGRSRDTCPVFTEPILKAWQLPFGLLERDFTSEQLEGELSHSFRSGQARVVLLGE